MRWLHGDLMLPHGVFYRGPNGLPCSQALCHGTPTYKGLVAKPRPTPANAPALPGADYIPAAVRREVWERDQGSCQWKLDSGGICGSKLRVEIDHVRLKCRGATPVAAELRILCRVHNLLAAREAVGNEVMDRHCRDPRQPALLGLDGIAGD